MPKAEFFKAFQMNFKSNALLRCMLNCRCCRWILNSNKIFRNGVSWSRTSAAPRWSRTYILDKENNLLSTSPSPGTRSFTCHVWLKYIPYWHLINTLILPMQGVFDCLAIAVMSSLSFCFFNRGNLADVTQLARKARWPPCTSVDHIALVFFSSKSCGIR
jgi:hypothetical protein